MSQRAQRSTGGSAPPTGKPYEPRTGGERDQPPPPTGMPVPGGKPYDPPTGGQPDPPPPPTGMPTPGGGR